MHVPLRSRVFRWFALTGLVAHLMAMAPAFAADAPVERRLYVAEPGIRNYLEYGGHGLLVFDMDRGFAFGKGVKTSGLDNEGKPDNVKGVVACARTGRIYVVTTKTLTCLDLETEKILWERPYLGGCDR